MTWPTTGRRIFGHEKKRSAEIHTQRLRNARSRGTLGRYRGRLKATTRLRKEDGAMAKEGVTSIVAIVLAFLTSQHHTLHMLLLTIGLGGAG